MKRREMLKTLGLTIGSGMLAPHLFASRNMLKSDVLFIEDKLEHPALDRPITAITLGAGARGNTYGAYAIQFPNELDIIGVAEPIPHRNNRYAKLHNIEDKNRFVTWEHVFERPKFADAIIITTPDALHYEPCKKALELGYDVLLEKPVAQSIKECQDIENLANKLNRIVAVCHVLRYAPYFIKMRQIIQSGTFGDVVSIQHIEPIEHIHMSHSYVRGNWHNSKDTTPIILAKSCHDLDILKWMIGKPCKQIYAIGDLKFFTKANRPKNAAKRCLDCPVESECVFSAKRIYLINRSWTYVFDLPEDKSKHAEYIEEQLRTTNYGRCVFDMENDQPDHYITSIEFEGNTTVAFSMEALTSYSGRRTRIMGTKGDIVGDMETMTITDFLTQKQTVWDSSNVKDVEEYKHSGHGGGDFRLAHDFVQAVAKQEKSLLVSTISESMESHIMGFKAEESRAKNKPIKVTG
ncbi:MAG: Gfo/Idh/MocA family protein [Tenuifilaceae bacterium]